MSLGIVGKKIGMTSIFADDGALVPVTVIEVETNRVSQIKTNENDGYTALQIATGKQNRSRLNKSVIGTLKKAGIEDGLNFREFRVDADQLPNYNLGQDIKLDQVFTDGQYVDVTGVTIGKGFAGTIKRHNFRSGDATHGNSVSHRVPGSIGQRQTPGRVFKGKKMCGHMGNVTRTTQNLQLHKIDISKNLLLVRGAVPGAKGGVVIVRPTTRK